jgi:hypothetical protein
MKQTEVAPRVLNLGTKYTSSATQGEPGSNLNYRDFDVVLFSLPNLSGKLAKANRSPEYHVEAVIAELNKLKAYIETGRIAAIWLAERGTIVPKGNALDVKLMEVFRKFPLPIDVAPLVGDKITAASSAIASLFEGINNGISYCVRYEPRPHIPLAYADIDSARCVASGFVTENNGVLLCLPMISDNIDHRTLTRTIVEIAEHLRQNYGPRRAALPAWAQALTMPSEALRKAEILHLESQIVTLNRELETTRIRLQDTEARKQLFAGQGTALRDQVAWALRTLGFRVETHDGNRVDITASYNGVPFVVEVKGKKKSAGEDDVAQLMKWDHEYVEEFRVAPQCLLVVNAFCETPLAERLGSTEYRAFPENVLKLAASRNHRLITGLQLFNMAHEAESNPARASEIAELLLSGPAEITGFAHLPYFAQ